MRLKSLHMLGFKSFANKTSIEFEPGFTALVGPNGCGKSNVVDAIRWALGEKSAKSIRGEKMEDVIFSGSEDSRAVSFAEVALKFEDTNGILPIEGKIITITRRLFRDGESEYLINNKHVRLKEIESLFYDTGIGKNAYSVLEQGKIDLIISTKPEERRYIFEEAAGISRYKQQKKEALRKLDDTQKNINRVSDILREVERERAQKKDQAEKANKYKALREQLKSLEIRHYVLKAGNLGEKSEKFTEKLHSSNLKKESLIKKVSSVTKIIEDIEFKKNEIQLSLFEKEKEQIALHHILQNYREGVVRNKSSIQETNDRLKTTEGKIVKREANISKINQQISLLNDQEQNIMEQLNIHEKIITEKLEIKTTTASEIKEAENNIINNRGLIISIEKEEQNLQERLKEVIGKLVIAIEKRKKELEVEEVKRSQVKVDIYQRLESFENVIKDIQGILESGEVDSKRESLTEKFQSLDFVALRQQIQVFESFEDGFRSIFFDREGIHSQKESLQDEIIGLRQNRESLTQEIIRLEKFILETREGLEIINNEISAINITVTKDRNELSWIEKQKSLLNEQLNESSNQLGINKQEIQSAEKEISRLNREIFQADQELAEKDIKEMELRKALLDLKEKKGALDEQEKSYLSDIAQENSELESINPEIINLEKSILEIKVKEEQLRESLYQDYELLLEEATEEYSDQNLEISEINKQIYELKNSINGLGIINHLALEEYKELSERFEFYQNQFQDMDKARADIHKLIKDIDNVSMKLFKDSFENIRKSFGNLFAKLFEGGIADVKLVDESDPLESGIDIIVQPPGKNPKHLSLLSGGEKSLIAIALLFATYESKPSPFCFLDEIDAALDESNIDRFINLLGQFSHKSQFIVITHSKRTMSMAETLYGVTMEIPGISKLVSIKLEDKNREKAVV